MYFSNRLHSNQLFKFNALDSGFNIQTMETLRASPEDDKTLFIVDDVLFAPSPSTPLFAVINGDGGNNTLVGTVDDDTLNGLGGDDMLNGAEGNDIVNGDDGNDTIFIETGHGTDTIDGGADTDTLIYFGFITDLTVNLATGMGSFASISNVENVTTNIGNDIVTGTSGDNIIITNAGNDTINAGAGMDDIDAGDDDDLIIDTEAAAITDSDTYDGGNGIDTLDYTATNWFTSMTVNLTTGFQTHNGQNRDSISNIENVTVSGSANILGDNGNNVLIATDDFVGENDIQGQGGDDTIMGGGGNDTLDGGSGTDTIDGGDGDDIIIGGGGNTNANIITAGAGNDTITMSGAGDTDAGTGDDMVTILLTGAMAGQTADGGDGTDTLIRDAQFSVAHWTFDMTSGNTNFANETFVNFENLTLGNNATNAVLGTSGANTIIGGTGEDNISGLAGADILDGGDGIDTLNYSLSNAAVTVSLSTGAVSGGHADGDTVSNFESVRGSIHDDLLKSSVFGGHIDGQIGDDEIHLAPTPMVGPVSSADGGSGDDIILLTGNVYEQDVDGGSGIDTLSLGLLSDGYFVNFALGTIDDGMAGNAATFANIEIFILSDGGDLVLGDAADTTFQSGAGVDFISGGDGNDRFIFSDLNNDMQFGEIYNGEGGIDDVIFEAYDLSGFVVDLELETISMGASSLDIREIENYDGTLNDATSDEEVRGTAADNILLLGAGDNIVAGQGGADTLDGGAGLDILDYSESSAGVTVSFEFATQTASGGHATGDVISNFENIFGSAFDDDLTGGAGLNQFAGGDGNDLLDGGDGMDFLLGDAGDDTILGGDGADVNDGGDGFDTMDYRGAASGVILDLGTGGTLGDAAGDMYNSIERVYGSFFNDTITGTVAGEYLYGEAGDDTINGGDGADRIYGGGGNDIQNGDGGNDTLYGSAGADALNGGAGSDTASYFSASSGVTLNAATGGTVGDAAGDTYTGIEIFTGSAHVDSITGNAAANDLRGGGSDDVLDGGAGNDRLHGQAGADTLIGGGGTDAAYYTTAGSGVTVNLATGGTVGDANGDTYSGIENVFGSFHNDDITGDSGINALFGVSGDDTVSGEGGNDLVYGQNGMDVLNGGTGNDRLYGGADDDTLNGDDGVDTLYGEAGDDTMFGGLGADFFIGGAGADSHDGGDGSDTVTYFPSGEAVRVFLSTGGTAGDAAGDTYTSIERVFGSSFDDIIVGSGNVDTLFGMTGDDYISSGAGADRMFGGLGDDEFGYNTGTDGIDRIMDFNATTELVYIVGGDPAFDTFAEVMAVGTDIGADVRFSFGGGNFLTLVGTQLADLSAANFDFSNSPPAGEQLDDKDLEVFASESFDSETGDLVAKNEVLLDSLPEMTQSEGDLMAAQAEKAYYSEMADYGLSDWLA